jgi:hypothetical protein
MARIEVGRGRPPSPRAMADKAGPAGSRATPSRSACARAGRAGPADPCHGAIALRDRPARLGRLAQATVLMRAACARKNVSVIEASGTVARLVGAESSWIGHEHTFSAGLSACRPDRPQLSERATRQTHETGLFRCIFRPRKAIPAVELLPVHAATFPLANSRATKEGNGCYETTLSWRPPNQSSTQLRLITLLGKKIPASLCQTKNLQVP